MSKVKVSRNKSETILSNFICSTLLTLVNFLYLLLYLYIEEGMFVYQVYIFTDGLSIVSEKIKLLHFKKKIWFCLSCKIRNFHFSRSIFGMCVCFVAIHSQTDFDKNFNLSTVFASILIFAFH